eukprot:scaffold46411_cov68-Phaeocystis_antarctica.AAC.10
MPCPHSPHRSAAGAAPVVPRAAGCTACRLAADSPGCAVCVENDAAAECGGTPDSTVHGCHGPKPIKMTPKLDTKQTPRRTAL